MAAINGLRGVDVEVRLYGTQTCGKPYAFVPTRNCENTYFTIQYQGVNDKGFGDYGFPRLPDLLAQAIVGNGGAESACGWCKDKWGLSWQITPRVLTQAINDPDRAAAKRAFDAMMGMRKIDVAAIEAAWRG